MGKRNSRGSAKPWTFSSRAKDTPLSPWKTSMMPRTPSRTSTAPPWTGKRLRSKCLTEKEGGMEAVVVEEEEAVGAVRPVVTGAEADPVIAAAVIEAVTGAPGRDATAAAIVT